MIKRHLTSHLRLQGQEKISRKLSVEIEGVWIRSKPNDRLKQVQVVFRSYGDTPCYDFLIPSIDDIVIKVDNYRQLRCRSKPLKYHHFVDIHFRDPLIISEVVRERLEVMLYPYGMEVMEFKKKAQGNGYRVMLPGELPPKFLVETPKITIYGEDAALNFVGHPTTCGHCFTTASAAATSAVRFSRAARARRT